MEYIYTYKMFWYADVLSGKFWWVYLSIHKTFYIYIYIFQLLHSYTFPHICLLNNWTEGKYMLLYADIENHLALRPDLLMVVGTPGRRHSFFPCNLKSNKSRLIIFDYLAYHSVYYIQIKSGKSISWQPFPYSEGKGNKVKHSKLNNTKLQCAFSRRSLELIRQL